MKIKMTSMLALLMVGMTLFAQERPVEVPAGPESAQRVEFAMGLALKEFARGGLRQSDDAVAKAIAAPYSAQFGAAPALSEVRNLSSCDKLARAELDKAAAVKYPELTALQMQDLAAQKFPLYKVGEKISVTYMANPQYPSTLTGLFQGAQGGVVRVGKHRVRIADMEGVAGNAKEVMKFLPEQTNLKRQEFIEQYIRDLYFSRSDFARDNYDAFFEKAVKDSGILNEKADYTCLGGVWLGRADFLAQIAYRARKVFEDRLQQQKSLDNLHKASLVLVQAETVAVKAGISPNGKRLNPLAILEAQDKTAADKAAAEQKRQEEEKAREETEIAEQASKQATSKKPAPAAESEAEEEESISHTRHIVLAAVVCAAIAIVIISFCVHTVHQRREKKRFTKFFEGKGQVQKDFWAMAESDPEHFKYVAYLFPSLKEATQALQKLTYIQTSPNGDLCCSRDIRFGVYPHQDGAVAFLGGANFHYAPWREATAVLPELPGAKYFKVSSEPEVMLEIPDFDKLDNLHIENLGIEDIADPQGGFNRCYKYRADSKVHAIAFLEDFQINEEGIVIHVETPEGSFGKDENGIFSL